MLLATSAATELAAHLLSMGDIDGVFWATGQGLKVLPGHEELIALRMRAQRRAGDLSGVRQEWECYERVLDADPWGDGEPAPKLVMLRRELLSSDRRTGPIARRIRPEEPLTEALACAQARSTGRPDVLARCVSTDELGADRLGFRDDLRPDSGCAQFGVAAWLKLDDTPVRCSMYGP